MEGGTLPTGLTSLLFGVGLLLVLPSLAFQLIFKRAMERWDREWLALKRQRCGGQFREFVESYDQVARRLSRLAGWLAIGLGIVLVTFMSYAATVIAISNLHRDLWRLLILLLSLIWIMAAPVFSLKLLSGSYQAGAMKIRKILATEME